MCLREKVPFLRNMPAFIDKLVDSAPMLKVARRRHYTYEGLEDRRLI